MAQRERPLSPFLHYRWQYTNTLSILHRVTGVFLSLGFSVMLLLVFNSKINQDLAFEDEQANEKQSYNRSQLQESS